MRNVAIFTQRIIIFCRGFANNNRYLSETTSG